MQPLGARVGNGYHRAKSRHIFRGLVDATALVEITPHAVEIPFQKRTRNPLLFAAGYGTIDTRIPWLSGKQLRLAFG